jgi:hypothetical protein
MEINESGMEVLGYEMDRNLFLAVRESHLIMWAVN